MKFKNSKELDLVVIGSGLAGLNFIDTYLEKNKKIHVISPNINKLIKKNKNNKFRLLPSQMSGKGNIVENYFLSNNIDSINSCKAIGSLNAGGLSDFWGLQLDSYLNKDQNSLKKNTFRIIENSFLEFLQKYNLFGVFYKRKKLLYSNDYKIPKFLNKLTEIKNSNFICKKPILAFSKSKLKKNEKHSLDEENEKITAKNFIKKINRKKIIFYNYFVENIVNKGKHIEIICRNQNKEKRFIAKKVIFATGTIASTKIIMNFLNIKNEVKIKHHPRLFSMFISLRSIKSNLKFTPSLMQIINKSKKDCFAADLRPGNKHITDSIIEVFPFIKPFKFLINFINQRLLFSNILLDSSHSDIFLKKEGKKFKLYNKSKNLLKKLKERNKKIFKFLTANKIILPFFKTYYPGSGADYHYFGSIPFSKNGNLSVNNNCQLNSKKNIYIIDGSVFDFKTNKYPLGLIIANARRIGRLLSK